MMKTKMILIGLIAVIGLAGVWMGLAARRAHHKLVTLQVRNRPVAEVARLIEKQVREKIRVDQKLNGVVTLDVKNKPLNQVLDSIAEQVGARWGRTYAVYSSEGALRRLEPVLQANGDLDSAGWTNVAPRFDATTLVPPPEFAGGDPRKIIMTAPGGGGLSSGGHSGGFVIDEDVREGAQITTNADGTVRAIIRAKGEPGGKIVKMGPGKVVVEDTDSGGGGGGGGHQMRSLTVRRVAGPGGITTTMTDGDGRVKVTRTSADGTVLKQEEWSSERLVIETLLGRNSTFPEKATAETAGALARQVHGKCATYYSLEKPPIPGSEMMRGLVQSSIQGIHAKGGTNTLEMQGDIRARMEAEAKQRRLDELSKSPEQQVQRARQKQEAQTAP